MDEPTNGKLKMVGSVIGAAVLVASGGYGFLQMREPAPLSAPALSEDLSAIRAEIAVLRVEQARQATETAALIRLGQERNERLTALERRVDEEVRRTGRRP